MAQFFEPRALDFGSVHDLAVHGIEPKLGSALTVQSLLGNLSLSLSLCLSLSLPLSSSCVHVGSLSLSLSQNK